MGAILNIEDYKQRLRAKEQELLKDTRRAEASARDLSEPSTQDWSDASVNDEEKSGQINELDMDSTTLNQVRDALKRTEEGTFGTCVVDGRPIEEKRLQAIAVDSVLSETRAAPGKRATTPNAYFVKHQAIWVVPNEKQAKCERLCTSHAHSSEPRILFE